MEAPNLRATHRLVPALVLAVLAAGALLVACGDDGPAGPGGSGRVLRVDARGGAGGDGSDWPRAFANLDSALATAGRDRDVRQIWVAAGTYRPGSAGGFSMVSDVALYGGFAGTEASLTDRERERHETILEADGALHVVNAELIDGGALDGFTLSGGSAGGSRAENGGGAFFQIATRDRPPTVRNCRFVGNRAEGFGGGLYVNRGTEVVNCQFLANEAGTGGGLFMHALEGDRTVVANCRFLGNGRNGSLSGGGGMTVWSETGATIVGNLYSGNVADFGSGLSVVGDAAVVNCTFSNNTTRLSKGVAGLRASSGQVLVANCILWDNRNADGRTEVAQLQAEMGGELDVRSSCIDSLLEFSGSGNISSDPLFVDADGADDVPGTVDDDLHLATGSACRSAGDASLLPADVADLDGDGDTSEVTPIDLDGAPRGSGQTARGAYE